MSGLASAATDFEQPYQEQTSGPHNIAAYVKSHSPDLWLQNFEQMVQEVFRRAQALKPRLDIIAQDAQNPDGVLSQIINARKKSVDALKSLQATAIKHCEQSAIPRIRDLRDIFEFETETLVASHPTLDRLAYGITIFDKYLRKNVPPGVLESAGYPGKFDALQAQAENVLQQLSCQCGVDVPSIRFLLENSLFSKEGVWDMDTLAALVRTPEDMYNWYLSEDYWGEFKKYSILDDTTLEYLKGRMKGIMETALQHYFPERVPRKEQPESEKPRGTEPCSKDGKPASLKYEQRTDPLSADTQFYVDGVRDATPYQDWTGRALEAAKKGNEEKNKPKKR